MCGRMNISDHEGIQWLLDQLGLILPEEQFTPKYNVSPTSRKLSGKNRLLKT